MAILDDLTFDKITPIGRICDVTVAGYGWSKRQIRLLFVARIRCTLLCTPHGVFEILQARSDAAPILSAAEMGLNGLCNVFFRAVVQHWVIRCQEVFPCPSQRSLNGSLVHRRQIGFC